MDQNEAPVVSIDSDGNVLKCAKGMMGDSCGYKPGMKMCGKCGAMAMRVKLVPDDASIAEKMMGYDILPEEEEMPKPMKKKAKKRMMPSADMPEMDMEEDEEDDEEMPMEAQSSEMPEMEEETPEAEETPEMEEEAEGETEEEGEEEEEEETPEEEMEETDEEYERMKKMRNRRLATMGMKSHEIGETGYVCAIERKAYPGSAAVCDNCPGGCVAEKGMPGLLHAEGIAEDMFEGKTIDSGYSSAADMFVVDVETKDGNSVEVFIDGTTAEVMGWHKLSDEISGKSNEDEMNIIGFEQAAEIAVKSIEGSVVAVEPDSFEGIDSYAVEIDGIDGKSYDVFVALDGEVLGFDKYEPEEAAEIEAEAAEIALKRAFSEERRMQLAEEGMALPDGSYPIVTESDLRNAIQAYGRAKDKEAAKAHIMKRARKMGKMDLIPENWKASEKEDVEVLDVKQEAEFLASLAEFQILESEIDSI